MIIVNVWDAPGYPEGTFQWITVLRTRSMARAFYRTVLESRRVGQASLAAISGVWDGTRIEIAGPRRGAR